MTTDFGPLEKELAERQSAAVAHAPKHQQPHTTSNQVAATTAAKVPYLVTCRRCGQQHVQFSNRHDDLRRYCSAACKSAVHRNAAAYPEVAPQPLSMDEYVQIAFTIPVIASSAPKPKPAAAQHTRFVPRHQRKPKRDPLDFRCPNKFKRIYQTEAAAWDFIHETFPDDDQIKPYKCVCGAIHIGHSHKKPS